MREYAREESFEVKLIPFATHTKSSKYYNPCLALITLLFSLITKHSDTLIPYFVVIYLLNAIFFLFIYVASRNHQIITLRIFQLNNIKEIANFPSEYQRSKYYCNRLIFVLVAISMAMIHLAIAGAFNTINESHVEIFLIELILFDVVMEL